MDQKLFRATFSKLKASERSKEEILNMTEEQKKNKRRSVKLTRVIAVAAAAACLLTLTAFADEDTTAGYDDLPPETKVVTDVEDGIVEVPDDEATDDEMTERPLASPSGEKSVGTYPNMLSAAGSVYLNTDLEPKEFSDEEVDQLLAEHFPEQYELLYNEDGTAFTPQELIGEEISIWVDPEIYVDQNGEDFHFHMSGKYTGPCGCCGGEFSDLQKGYAKGPMWWYIEGHVDEDIDIWWANWEESPAADVTNVNGSI